MKVRHFTAVFLIFLTIGAAAQQNFEKAVQNVLSNADYKNAQVGIHVLDLSSGESIFSLNADKLLIPASTLKLITTATALEILGPEYRFKTKIGFTGKIKNNTLKGDLIVIGGGDPALGSEYFNEYYFNPHFLDVWARQIKAAGIQKVDGNLILDKSVYDDERIPDTWIWQDIGNYYGAGPNALTVYDNLFRIDFKSPKRAGEKTTIISTFPKIDEIEIKNEVLSSGLNKDLAYVYGSPFDNLRIIRGTIPKNRKLFTIKAAIQKPEELLADEFLKHLAGEGIFINGKILYEKTNPAKTEMIYIQDSPTLGEIVKVTNHESVNLFAEHLLKQLSAEQTGIGSRKQSIELLKDFWQKNGFDSNNFYMEDGSGLSHFDAVTPQFFTSILKYMFKSSSNFESFYNSLPLAGEGTLSGFQPENFPDNSLKAKSGSMTRIRCYSGYIKTDSGNNITYSIMFNQFSGSHSKLISETENLLLQLKKTQ